MGLRDIVRQPAQHLQSLGMGRESIELNVLLSTLEKDEKDKHGTVKHTIQKKRNIQMSDLDCSILR